VEFEGLEDGHVHAPAVVCELAFGSYLEEWKDIFQEDLLYWFGEVIPSVPVSPVTYLLNVTQPSSLTSSNSW